MEDHVIFDSTEDSKKVIDKVEEFCHEEKCVSRLSIITAFNDAMKYGEKVIELEKPVKFDSKIVKVRF